MFLLEVEEGILLRGFGTAVFNIAGSGRLCMCVGVAGRGKPSFGPPLA